MRKMYVDWQVKQIHTYVSWICYKEKTLEYEREFLTNKSRNLNMLLNHLLNIFE